MLRADGSRVDGCGDCARWRDALDAFLDDELEKLEVLLLEAHLEDCASCREELHFAREVRAELRALPMLDAPEQASPAPVTPMPAPVSASDSGPVVSSFPPPASPSGSWRLALAAGLGVLAISILWWMLPGAGDHGQNAGRPAGQSAGPASVEEAVEVSGEVVVAEAEARLALAYIGRAGRRAGLEVRDTVLREAVLEPVAKSLARTLPAWSGDHPKESSSVRANPALGVGTS